MSKTLDRLLKSNGLFCVDFRTGSPKDIVGNLTYTTTSTPFITCGQGLKTNNWNAPSYISYGNYHDLPDLATPCSWIVGYYNEVRATSDWVLFGKMSGVATSGWMFDALNQDLSFAIYTPTGIMSAYAGMVKKYDDYVVVTYDGSKSGTGIRMYFEDGTTTIGTGSTTSSTNTDPSTLKIGGAATNVWNKPNRMRLAAMLNRVLTPLEIATLSKELRSETPPGLLDTPHRHYSFPYKTLSPAQATTQGLVLDTDFVRSSDGKVRNFAPTSYTGTIVGNPVPAGEGKGITFLGSNRINFDNVAEQNNATQTTIIARILPTEDSPKYIWFRISDSTHGIYLYVPSPGFLTAWIANGTSSFGISASRCMYSGVEQEIAIVYDGTGATNTDRLKMYINGALVTLSYTNTIPATMANMAAQSFYYGGGSGTNTFNHTSKKFRCYSTALTAAQVRAEYLEGAKELLVDGRLRSDGSCPVGLTAITTPNTKVPGTIWQTNADAVTGARVIEDSSTRERYLYVNNGELVTVQPEAFGSWYFEWNSSDTLELMPIASHPFRFLQSPNTGYMVYQNAVGVRLSLVTPGSASDLIAASGGTSYNNKYMRGWLSRTHAGVFTLYVNAGSGWILLGTATNTAYVTSAFASYKTVGASERLYNFMHFAGAMTPAEAIGLGLIDP